MACKHFRLHLAARILLIVLNVFLFFYLLFNTRFYALTLLAGLLPILQTWLLIRFTSRAHRMLARFFDTIMAGDFGDRIPAPFQEADFQELSGSLNRILASLADTRAESEQQRRFYQSVIQQLGVGLIAFKADGTVDFINKSARRMLRVPNLKHIRNLDKKHADLAASLPEIRSGRRQWITVGEDGRKVRLSLFAQTIRLPGNDGYKLLTLQNLEPELEEKEVEAWKNLIRVLSHEIMNSITPISSLASTAAELIPAEDAAMRETHADLHAAIEAIGRRSRGLMHFVRNYRLVAHIPAPRKEPVRVELLFKRLFSLLENQLHEQDVAFETRTAPPRLQIVIDPSLIEQVLLNLLSNAMDAVAGRPGALIRLTALPEHEQGAVIRVADNGPGIEDSLLEKVFIPFFTTKEKGSGVGLSISRQIMQMHGGSLHIRSRPGRGVTVTLLFPS